MTIKDSDKPCCIPRGKMKVIKNALATEKIDRNTVIKINCGSQAELSTEQRIKNHIKAGEIFMSQHKAALAIEEYTKAINIDTTCITAYNKRGHACFSTGRWREALADFSMILSLAPDRLPGGNTSSDYERWMKNASRALKKSKTKITARKQPKTEINSSKCMNFSDLKKEESDK